MKRYLRDPDTPSHLRKLVESAGKDGLDEARRRRVAERLGLALPAVQLADTNANAKTNPNTTPEAPAGAASWPSVGAIALAVMAVAGGGVAYVRGSHSRPTQQAPINVAPSTPAVPAPAPKLPPSEMDTLGSSDVSALPEAPAEKAATKRRAAPAADAQRSDGDLRLEIIALDEVRQATSSGNPRRALELLDAYATKFPAGKLREEALVLRIEALHAAGDQPAADALARRLLRESPNTPYAARVRAALVDP